MKLQYNDGLYGTVESITGIDPDDDTHITGVIVVTEHGHDTMPITLFSRVAWRCDDALFKIANPGDWFGYNNCADEDENDRLLRHLLETFEGLGLTPEMKRRTK